MYNEDYYYPWKLICVIPFNQRMKIPEQASGSKEILGHYTEVGAQLRPHCLLNKALCSYFVGLHAGLHRKPGPKAQEVKQKGSLPPTSPFFCHWAKRRERLASAGLSVHLWHRAAGRAKCHAHRDCGHSMMPIRYLLSAQWFVTSIKLLLWAHQAREETETLWHFPSTPEFSM